MPQLTAFCEAILADHALEESQAALRGLNSEPANAVAVIVRCLKGVLSICSPTPKFPASAAEVEAISRPKKKAASTVKGSSTSVGAQSSGPESAIMQLITASEWWQEQCAEFWRHASQSQILTPLLKKCIEAMDNDQDDGPPTTDWLIEAVKSLQAFNDGLRPGSFNGYKTYVFEKLGKAVSFVTKCSDMVGLEVAGLAKAMDVLPKALEFFKTNPQATRHQEALQKWYSDMKGSFLQQDMEKFVDGIMDWASVEWDSLSKMLKQIEGIKLAPAAAAKLFGLTPFLFANALDKACSLFV